MKDNLKKLLISVAKTSGFSAVVGGVAYFTGHPFVFYFALAFFVQFVAFYIFNTFLQYKAIKDAKAFAIKQAELIAINTIKVECASCKKESDVLVRLDQENKFTCGYCNTKNAIYINPTTAVVTEPLYETTPLPNIIPGS